MSETLKVNVPDDIRRMTPEELEREIARLEAEARMRREERMQHKKQDRLLV